MAGRNYIAPPGYSNATEVAVRRAEVARELADERAEQQAELSEESAATISEITAGIVEEAQGNMPFADSTSPTGAELAEVHDAEAVMNLAVRAASAAHAQRAAARVPELPSHEVLVQRAASEILSPPVEADDSDEYDVADDEADTGLKHFDSVDGVDYFTDSQGNVYSTEDTEADEEVNAPA